MTRRGLLVLPRLASGLRRRLPDPSDPIVLGLSLMAVGAICMWAGFSVLLR